MTHNIVELDRSNEIKLVRQFQDGDIEAFNPLILKYQQKIYNLIYLRVHDQETAKDLCQDVFLKAFKALSNFKGECTFYSWIYRIAENCTIDFLRKQKHGMVLSLEELSANTEGALRMMDMSPSPCQILENKELGYVIRKAVSHLPPHQQRVFDLRYRKELSIKEIALHLNRTEGTIKRHLYNAHQQLRNMLLPYLRNEQLEWL